MARLPQHPGQAGGEIARRERLPLFAETVPGLGVGSWVGLVAPAGTPRAAIGLLADTLQKSLKDPKLVEIFEKIGVDVEYQPAAAFGKLIADEPAPGKNW